MDFEGFSDVELGSRKPPIEWKSIYMPGENVKTQQPKYAHLTNFYVCIMGECMGSYGHF